MDPATFSPGFALFFLLSIFGWGSMGRYFCDRRLFRFHALQAILGLALLNVAGGALNLLGLATSPVLRVLLLGGAVLGVMELWKTRPWRKVHFGLRSSPLFLALGFAFAADLMLATSEVFNIHDDFHTYAMRAVRMSQTGSVGGDAFDPLGLDSFGSQSFFHGFFLWGTDIRFLNGFDVVVCFALCLLLAAEISMRWRLPWMAGALAVLCVAVINPQCVNISPLYSGAAAIMALVVCGMFLGRSLASGRARNDRRAEITLGLLAAWLLTLKITLAMFGALFLGLFYLFLLARGSNRVEILKSAAITAGASVMLALPWIFVPLPALLKTRELGLRLKPDAILAAKHPSIAAHNIPALFSTSPLFYGDRPLSFLFLVAACAGMGLFGAWMWIKRGQDRRSASGAAIAAAGLAVAPVFLAFGDLFPVETAVRYSCPILIGAFIAAILGCLRLTGSPAMPRFKPSTLALSGCLIAVILIFSGTFWSRAISAAADRTLIAFPVNTKHADSSRKLVSRGEKDYQRSIQARMPPGATALVWTLAPFQMDFSRNRLLTLSISGIINPALQFPAGAGLESFENYLRGNGVRFVLMETNGFGVSKLDELRQLAGSRLTVHQKYGDFGAYLHVTLLALAENNPMRYADDRMLLFELKDTPTGSPSPVARSANGQTSQDRGQAH
jgi:hypothetical protein